MLTSIRNVARPLLVAALLTPLSAPPSAHAAATVVSTAHYQATVGLSCNATAGFCIGSFPAVAAKKRLNLMRVSCYMRSSTYSTFAVGKITLTPGALVQYLPADHTTDWGHHVVNGTTDVQVAAGQAVSVALLLASGGQTIDGGCTAHGTMETLK